MRRKDFIKNWFSNMFTMDDDLVHENIQYRTVEHFYQAMKTNNWDERLKIAGMSPYEAKKYCKNSIGFKLREDWEEVKNAVMDKALRWKFRPGTEFHQMLMLTEDEEIVEVNNWHDNYWGSCKCKKCGSNGKNVLGELLMRIRLENKSNDKT